MSLSPTEAAILAAFGASAITGAVTFSITVYSARRQRDRDEQQRQHERERDADERANIRPCRSWPPRARPLHEAGRHIGHRSVVTTNRYAHLFDERDAEIAEAVDRLAREAAESRSRARNARPLRAPSGIASVTDLPHRP